MLAIFTLKYQKTFFVSETAIFVEIEIENTCSRTGEQKGISEEKLFFSQ